MNWLNVSSNGFAMVYALHLSGVLVTNWVNIGLPHRGNCPVPGCSGQIERQFQESEVRWQYRGSFVRTDGEYEQIVLDGGPAGYWLHLRIVTNDLPVHMRSLIQPGNGVQFFTNVTWPGVWMTNGYPRAERPMITNFAVLPAFSNWGTNIGSNWRQWDTPNAALDRVPANK